MLDPPPGLSNQVNQASGLVSVQAECDAERRWTRVIIRTPMMDQSVEHTALDVIDGRARFDI
jgi:hypothetical protein